VRAHVAVERRRPSHVGRRLEGLCRAAGLVELATTAATHVATGWDAGLPPIADLAQDMVATGDLDDGGAARFVAAVEGAARAGRLRVTLTMYSVAARRP